MSKHANSDLEAEVTRTKAALRRERKALFAKLASRQPTQQETEVALARAREIDDELDSLAVLNEGADL